MSRTKKELTNFNVFPQVILNFSNKQQQREKIQTLAVEAVEPVGGKIVSNRKNQHF